jgi:hypothetical protein
MFHKVLDLSTSIGKVRTIVLGERFRIPTPLVRVRIKEHKVSSPRVGVEFFFVSFLLERKKMEKPQVFARQNHAISSGFGWV